jgi:hypothetical protein
MKYEFKNIYEELWKLVTFLKMGFMEVDFRKGVNVYWHNITYMHTYIYEIWRFKRKLFG